MLLFLTTGSQCCYFLQLADSVVISYNWQTVLLFLTSGRQCCYFLQLTPEVLSAMPRVLFCETRKVKLHQTRFKVDCDSVVISNNFPGNSSAECGEAGVVITKRAPVCTTLVLRTAHHTPTLISWCSVL